MDLFWHWKTPHLTRCLFAPWSCSTIDTSASQERATPWGAWYMVGSDVTHASTCKLLAGGVIIWQGKASACVFEHFHEPSMICPVFIEAAVYLWVLSDTLVSTCDCIWQSKFSSTYAEFGIISCWTGSCSSMKNIHFSCLQPCHIFWVIAPPRASSGNSLFPQQHSNLQPDWEAMLTNRQSLLVGMHPVYCSRGSPFLQWYRQLSVMVQFRLAISTLSTLQLPTSLSLPTPIKEMGRRIREENKTEFMDWDTNSFITKTNVTIILIKIRGREGGKTKEEVMHNVHRLLTDDQPVPEPQSPSCSWLTPCGLYPEHDVLWNGTWFWPCVSQVASQLFV